MATTCQQGFTKLPEIGAACDNFLCKFGRCREMVYSMRQVFMCINFHAEYFLYVMLLQKMDSYFFNPSNRTMALGSTQPLTEMSTRNLPGR
jgi:hypothetical protein